MNSNPPSSHTCAGLPCKHTLCANQLNMGSDDIPPRHTKEFCNDPSRLWTGRSELGTKVACTLPSPTPRPIRQRQPSDGWSFGDLTEPDVGEPDVGDDHCEHKLSLHFRVPYCWHPPGGANDLSLLRSGHRRCARWDRSLVLVLPTGRHENTKLRNGYRNLVEGILMNEHSINGTNKVI